VEQGWYEGDVPGLLGALGSELFRARRLVVDTGLHTKGWTRQQAIDYGIGAQEVERYVVWPGQACAYMIGMLRILELREKAKAALGDKFSLPAFHDVVLKNGVGAAGCAGRDRPALGGAAEEGLSARGGSQPCRTSSASRRQSAATRPHPHWSRRAAGLAGGALHVPGRQRRRREAEWQGAQRDVDVGHRAVQPGRRPPCRPSPAPRSRPRLPRAGSAAGPRAAPHTRASCGAGGGDSGLPA
jgi:hypothetical protein